jgi:hypothetical protein
MNPDLGHFYPRVADKISTRNYIYIYVIIFEFLYLKALKSPKLDTYNLCVHVCILIRDQD